MPKTAALPTKRSEPDRSVTDRWSAALVTEGFTPVSNFFLRNYHRLPRPMTTAESMLVVHLMSFKWDKEAPFPGFKTLAERMGLSAAGVRAQARNLEKKGYLKREMQIGTTNKFHLDGLFKALETLQRKDETAVLGKSKIQQLRALVDSVKRG